MKTKARGSRALRALFLWCALAAPAHAAQFAFAAFGDMPYTAVEEAQLISMIAEMNRERLAFVVHVGDFKSSQMECSDELFLQRRDAFGLSHHPFVFIPGDNEWVDCPRAHWAPRDPLERLRRLREIFFAADTALGQRPLTVERQVRRGYPEHLRWTTGEVLFATLNIPGPNNNARNPPESQQRTAAVLEWMREAFTVARERKLPALVIAVQANLWSGNRAYEPIVLALAHEAQRYKGEVLVVHGDTHWYRFDRPLVDPRSGAKVENVSRIEVFGSPFVNWVYVTVTIENGRARFGATPGSEIAAKGR
ncbi:MAG TPA: hypothetical protein VFB75_24040 [Burkholderiales bacterium]|nr:hypothetical protein [Burkholderiales bacterium]